MVVFLNAKFHTFTNYKQSITILFCYIFIFQSLYTLFFWITLRQFMQERFERRNTSALEDMAAPLQITVGPATRGKTEIFCKMYPFMITSLCTECRGHENHCMNLQLFCRCICNLQCGGNELHDAGSVLKS
jgi:hypothetical protein